MKSPYYIYQLEDAQIFQDWLMVELAKRGIIIQVFSSKEYQFKTGETFSRDEIKFDKKQLEYGNLAIEEYERTDENNPFYVESGINRQNIIRWIQGNYQNVWIFEFNKLKEYVLSGVSRPNNPLRRYVTPTSKGILLPCYPDADKICTIKIPFVNHTLDGGVQITRPNPVVYQEEEKRKEKTLDLFGVREGEDVEAAP